MINADSFMMFTIITGFVVCGAYFRGQYRDWRRQRTAHDNEKVRFRLSYSVDSESSHQQESVGERGVDLAGGSFIRSFVHHS
jgi:hypothetical protein